MGHNPFARQMAADERVLSRQIGQDLTRALRASRVQRRADAATTSTTRRPPREVTRIFEEALAREIRGVARANRSITIDTCICYALQRSSWQATVNAVVRYRTQSRGGVSHTLAQGDTLWTVAERYYGHGAYWSAIADENPRALNSRQQFLMCGAILRIPRIDVVPEIRDVPSLARQARPPREAQRPARTPELPFPEIQCTMQHSRPVTLGPVCMGGVTVEVTIEPSGSLVVNRPGTVPARFDCRRYRAQVQAEIGRITAAFRISSFTTGRFTISNRLLGGRYTVALNLDTDGSFGFSISERRSETTIRGYRVTTSIGFEVTIRVTSTCGQPVGAPSAEGVRRTQGARSRGRNTAADLAEAGAWTAAAGAAAALGRVLLEFAGRALSFATMPIIIILPPGMNEQGGPIA